MSCVQLLVALSGFHAAPFLPRAIRVEAPKMGSPATTDGETLLSARTIVGLGCFGATCGPLVDAVHNQALLQYDRWPITIEVFDAKTSGLIPPLLAITYVLLGSVLPLASQTVVGRDKAFVAPCESAPRGAVAAFAVVSTVAIIKLSEVLTLAGLPAATTVSILFAGCMLQWASLDGKWASLALALLVAIGGPLAELPFLAGNCWHYVAPDYFPLEGIMTGWADLGLNYCTAPCYFAVTTDAIAIGRWLAASENP